MINKNYFKYLLRTTFPLLIVCAVVAIIGIGLFPFMTYMNDGSLANYNYTISYIYQLQQFYIILVFLAVAVPLFMHSRYYSKNSSDIFLSLPMNRQQAFFTENAFGLIAVVGSTILGFLFGVMFTAVANYTYYMAETYGQIFQAFPILLIAIICVYLMSNLAVNLSNSMLEAIFMIIAVFMIPLLLWEFVISYIISPFYEFPYRMINLLTFAPIMPYSAFASAISYKWNGYQQVYTVEYQYYGENILILLINFIVWVGLNVFGYQRFIKMKSEHLGTATMESFAGPDAHAVLFFLCFFFCGMGLHPSQINMYILTYFIAFLVIYWISLFILRRKITFRKDDLIRFVISLVTGVFLGMLLETYLSTLPNR